MTINSIKAQFTSNYLEVVQEINLKIADSTNKAKATFDIFIKKETNKKYDIEVNRSRFLINTQEIENKFLNICNQYMSCLYPIRFSIQEQNKLVIVNFDEISNRIKQRDLILSQSMEGEGLEIIKSEFFEKTNTDKKLQTLISSLGIVTIIEMSLMRYSQNTAINLLWTVPVLGDTHWQTQIKKENQNNSISFISELTDQKEVLENLQKYSELQELKLISDNQESEIFATFETTINYMSNMATIADSQTQVNIKIGDFFEYQENITILSTIDK